MTTKGGAYLHSSSCFCLHTAQLCLFLESVKVGLEIVKEVLLVTDDRFCCRGFHDEFPWPHMQLNPFSPPAF